MLRSQRTMTCSKLSSFVRHFSTSFHHLIRGTGKSTKVSGLIFQIAPLGKYCHCSLNNSYLVTIPDDQQIKRVLPTIFSYPTPKGVIFESKLQSESQPAEDFGTPCTFGMYHIPGEYHLALSEVVRLLGRVALSALRRFLMPPLNIGKVLRTCSATILNISNRKHQTW